MESVLQLFDRFRDAWHLNRANKSLYWPQVALTLVRVLVTLGAGAAIYSLTGSQAMARLLDNPNWSFLVPVLSPLLLIFVGCWLFLYLVGTVLEAGLYSMYKDVTLTGKVGEGAFAAGAARYSLSFILGDLLLLVVLTVLLPLWLVLGGITLTVGFGLLGLLWGAALMMWKVALVREDLGVLAAIKASLRFAQGHKLMVAVLYLIRQAFMRFGGPVATPNLNWRNNASDLPDWVNLPIMRDPLKVLQTLVLALTVLAAFAVAAWSLVQMFFHVFFGLVVFLVWEENSGEVSCDVV
jgi:hypothetical protein